MTEESPLNFQAEKQEGKRKYIFDFGKARICDHPTLRIVVRGTNKYTCDECNYDFWLPTAVMWPRHWGPIMAAFEIMGFVKQFGSEALEKVLRTKIGQVDGTPHKPVLPAGMSFADVLNEMDQMSPTAIDGVRDDVPALLESIARGVNGKEPDGNENGDESSLPPL